VGIWVRGRVRKQEGEEQDVFDVWATGGSLGGVEERHLAEVSRNGGGYVVRTKEGDQLDLLREVTTKLYEAAGDDPLPKQAVHLFAAIVLDRAYPLSLDDPDDNSFYGLIVETFGPCDNHETCHGVWGHISTRPKGE
jgi:hypothetical protein